MKNALLLTFVVFGFSKAQQHMNSNTQNGVDITPLIVELKSINAKLALMNQSDSLSSQNIVNALKNIDKKIDVIDKESDHLNELIYQKSASRSKLYYEGIGLKKLTTDFPKCGSEEGKKSEFYIKYCLDLQERVKKLIDFSSFAINGKSKMMLQDRIQIINKIFDIILKEKEYLEGISANDKIEDDYKKKAEEREQILKRKSSSR